MCKYLSCEACGRFPEQDWSPGSPRFTLPSGDHFRHDLRIAGQIGKPAEQGRCLPKNEGSKLCLSLLFSDIQRAYTSASHLACHASCHGAVKLRHLGRAGWNGQNKGTGRTWTLAEWLPLSSTKKPFLLIKSVCLHLRFQVQSGKFPPLVTPEWVRGKVSCGEAWVPRLLDGGGQRGLSEEQNQRQDARTERRGHIVVLSKALGSAGSVLNLTEPFVSWHRPLQWPVVLEYMVSFGCQPSRVWQSLDALG